VVFLDLRSFNTFRDSNALSQYQPAFSYELAGKTVKLPSDPFDSAYRAGDAREYSFAAFPHKTVEVDGDLLHYFCAKIADDVLLVLIGKPKPDALTAFTLNVGADGLALRLSVYGNGSNLAEGCFVSEAYPWTDVTKLDADFAGNTVEYTFGSDANSVITIEYGEKNAMKLTLGGMPPVQAAGPPVIIRVAEGVYIQMAEVAMGPQTARFALLCNFVNDYFVGAVSLPGNDAVVGGYIRINNA
jgi:hypothetical protein